MAVDGSGWRRLCLGCRAYEGSWVRNSDATRQSPGISLVMLSFARKECSFPYSPVSTSTDPSTTIRCTAARSAGWPEGGDGLLAFLFPFRFTNALSASVLHPCSGCKSQRSAHLAGLIGMRASARIGHHRATPPRRLGASELGQGIVACRPRGGWRIRDTILLVFRSHH